MEAFVDVVLFVFGGLLAVIGFFVKSNYDKQTALEEKFNNLHEVYVKKDDFKDFKEELWRRFDELKEEIRKK